MLYYATLLRYYYIFILLVLIIINKMGNKIINETVSYLNIYHVKRLKHVRIEVGFFAGTGEREQCAKGGRKSVHHFIIYYNVFMISLSQIIYQYRRLRMSPKCDMTRVSLMYIT